MGIFIANLANFSFYNESAKVISPYMVETWDSSMRFLHYMFIEGKFYSIFSLLFGWGIAMQLKRATNKGTDVFSILKRRLLIMLLLGAFHLLIWTGDIVFFYALLGFVMLPLLKFSNKTLLIQKLTNEPPVSPEAVYGLQTVEDVFEKFHHQSIKSLAIDLVPIDRNARYEKQDYHKKLLADYTAYTQSGSVSDIVERHYQEQALMHGLKFIKDNVYHFVWYSICT